ncbi:MAG: hypothetical protein H6618_10350 [Deltaproteobacteria bacterium]|nr:hypothetical protein [Deltaproteobacteria bacterium]
MPAVFFNLPEPSGKARMAWRFLVLPSLEHKGIVIFPGMRQPVRDGF